MRFFGDFEVFYQGAVVDLGRNSKAVAIFRRLLAHHPQPVSQEAIMGWLWPESRPQKARWSLNSATYAMRGVLGTLTPDLSECVVLDGGRYRISSGIRVSSDVQEFGAHYECGRLLERSGKIEEVVREYEEAVGFYRDDYLIQDLYEDWTMIERERLAGGYVDMLDRLSDYFMDDGQLQKSIGICYQILEKDPYHEEIYRRLMRCYSRLGLRSRASQQYELCRRMLGRLYGMTPAEETQALNRRVLRGEDI
ncbi:MAG: bacterial transcriptional activator domain-containing protein [Rubrobacteraceae bacterium]